MLVLLDKDLPECAPNSLKSVRKVETSVRIIPSREALAEVFQRGCLYDQFVDLSLDRKHDVGVEIAT
jgi:hypothetical protein